MYCTICKKVGSFFLKDLTQGTKKTWSANFITDFNNFLVLIAYSLIIIQQPSMNAMFSVHYSHEITNY